MTYLFSIGLLLKFSYEKPLFCK